MRLRVLSVSMIVLSISLLAGCGGGDSSTSTPSPFAGVYQGRFTSSLSQTGTLSLSVGNDGHLTGSSHNETLNLDSNYSGSIDSNGNMAATVTFPTQSATYTTSGTVAKNSSGHLVGTLTQFSGNTNIGSDTIDLTKQ